MALFLQYDGFQADLRAFGASCLVCECLLPYWLSSYDDYASGKALR